MFALSWSFSEQLGKFHGRGLVNSSVAISGDIAEGLYKLNILVYAEILQLDTNDSDTLQFSDVNGGNTPASKAAKDELNTEGDKHR